ncbi:MAG: hypothetical protein EBR40_11650 [Proteobacteria bacterium]|nr:hypothetical protein [Pseudomonadota bacterium]
MHYQEYLFHFFLTKFQYEQYYLMIYLIELKIEYYIHLDLKLLYALDFQNHYFLLKHHKIQL